MVVLLQTKTLSVKLTPLSYLSVWQESEQAAEDKVEETNKMAEVLKCYCGACTLTITGDPAVQVAVQSVQQILAHSVHATGC